MFPVGRLLVGIDLAGRKLIGRGLSHPQPGGAGVIRPPNLRVGSQIGREQQLHHSSVRPARGEQWTLCCSSTVDDWHCRKRFHYVSLAGAASKCRTRNADRQVFRRPSTYHPTVAASWPIRASTKRERIFLILSHSATVSSGFEGDSSQIRSATPHISIQRDR